VLGDFVSLIFVCFVWLPEQTAIISLYSINWLVFITKTECVYCAVRTEYIYKYISVQFSSLQAKRAVCIYNNLHKTQKHS